MVNSLKSRVVRLLRRSERYTNTDMVYLAKGSWWMSFGTVALIGLSFGTTVAFANLLPKVAYGTFQYALSIVDLLGILALPGIDAAISRSVAQGKEGSFREAVWAKLRWSAFASIAAVCVALYYFANGNTPLGGAMLIAGAMLPLFENLGAYVPLLQGKKRFDLLTLYEVGAQAVNSIAVIVALCLTDNVLVLLAVYLASWAIGRAAGLFATLRRVQINDTLDPGLIPYGKHLTALSAIGTVSSSVDKIILWHFLGPLQVAVYTFSLGVPLRVVGAFKSVNRLAFPKMANQDELTLRRTLPRKIVLLTLLAATVAAAYIAAAPLIFAILLPQYTEAVPYSRLAAALIVLQPVSLIATSLSAHAKKRALYVHGTAAPLVRIGLSLALIPTFHITGALVALIASKACEGAILFTLFSRGESRATTNST